MTPTCAYCGCFFDRDEILDAVPAPEGTLMHDSCYVEWREEAL